MRGHAQENPMTPLAWTIDAAAATAAVAASATLACATFVPQNQLWGKLYICAAPSTPGIALTFDDGPTPSSTSAILDILGELGVKAAFFVIGASARQYPELLQRMHAEGHIVANHTLDHYQWACLRGRRYWDRQLRETDRIIQQTIGVCPAMFGPPFGFKTFCVMSAAASQGKAVIAWSRRAFDGVKTTSQRIIQRLGLPTQNGEVLLLHDGVEPARQRDPRPTVEAIKPLIMHLRGRGLEPRPLDQFLNLPAYLPAANATPPS
jgi:peptidoglycan/xylan/chitin deacetylase (PgdA/CDA1 family)